MFKSFRLLLLFMAASVAILSVEGCSGKAEPLAKLIDLNGKVKARAAKDGELVEAKADTELFAGGGVKTEEEASARLDLYQVGTVEIKPDAYVEISENTSQLVQQSGAAIYRIDKNKNGFKVKNPHGVTAVLGTVFGQVLGKDRFELLVKEGVVEFTSKNGSVMKVNAEQKLFWNFNTTDKPEVTDAGVVEIENLFSGPGNLPAFNQR